MLSLWKQFDFNQLVNDLFKEPFFDSYLQPGIDHRKSDDGTFISTIDLPGVSEEDVSVEVAEGCVRIKGTKKTKNSSYCVLKSFSLPQECDTDKLQAHLKDGLLTLTMPSKALPPASEVKRIPINTSK